MNYSVERSQNSKINVTQPSLPPLSEYVKYLEKIWETGTLSHNGPMVQEFEKKLAEFLSIQNFVAVSNGTIAIQMAIKALKLSGEIITTPFTWIATLSAIQWEKCTPVFCDIDPDTLNIDVTKIESLINNKTAAILPVHVFGNPCNVFEIERIAKKHNLKVIYDAAHALGSTVAGKSVLEFGDISTVSLHATKLLNTGEGGGCITNKAELNQILQNIRFFGFDNKRCVVEEGLNGKMSEINAALGLANMNYFSTILRDRKKKYKIYTDGLKSKKSMKFQKLNGDGCNYSYFPIVFHEEIDLTRVIKHLEDNRVYPRRYFFPSLDTLYLTAGANNSSISSAISRRILCLPLYQNLEDAEINGIIKLVDEITD